MSPEDPIGIIALGNINIKCLIFKIDNDNKSEILSTSISESEGIHNGTVINLKKASSSIRSCISEAEKKAKVSLKKINVVFEEPDFLCTNFSKHKKIDGSRIHKDDIQFLLKEAKKQLVHNDESQSIIHIFNYNYIVDGKPFIQEPIGGAHRNSEEAILNTKEALIRNLNEFEDSTRESVFDQRKEKFLNVGKHKTFTFFPKDSEWIKKENFLQNFKQILFKFKKELIIISLLILVSLLFVI